MDIDQASAIFLPLLSAAEELDNARTAAAPIADDDIRAAEVATLATKLNTELLPIIIQHFGVLFPDISAQWGQIKLPSSVSESKLDAFILSIVEPDWKKMAFLVWDMIGRSDEIDSRIDNETFVARVRVLIESGQLDYKGDLLDWQSYEVRLKPS
jgi:hypothetical protein